MSDRVFRSSLALAEVMSTTATGRVDCQPLVRSAQRRPANEIARILADVAGSDDA